jgi:uncharacterized MAPEG superfamily protein
MTTELMMLVLCGLLSLALALATIAIHFLHFGGKTIRSNREEYPPLYGIAGRVVRAHANLTESLLPFTIVVLVANAVQVSNRWTIYGSEVFLLARLAHASLYISGIPEVRSIAFYVGLLATITTAAQLLR